MAQRRLLDELTSLRDVLRGMAAEAPAKSKLPEPPAASSKAGAEEQDIAEVKRRVRELARALGYKSLQEAADAVGVDWDGSEEAWRELLDALEGASEAGSEEEVEQA
jgi:hypothetical protein